MRANPEINYLERQEKEQLREIDLCRSKFMHYKDLSIIVLNNIGKPKMGINSKDCFQGTRLSCLLAIASPVIVNFGFEIFAPLAILRRPSVISTCFAAIFNIVLNMRSELMHEARNDTPLGNSIRNHFHILAINDPFIPSFEEHTRRYSYNREHPMENSSDRAYKGIKSSLEGVHHDTKL